MSMKPRLNDGPVSFPNLVNNPKSVPENAPLPNANLSSKTCDDKGAIGTNLSSATKGS